MKKYLLALCCIAAITPVTCLAERADSTLTAQTGSWEHFVSKLPRISGYLQTGWNYNSLNEGTSTFQVKRLRLMLDGTINERASFRLQVEGFSGTPAHHNGQKSLQIMDAYATYKFNQAIQVRAGQFNSPLCYENYNLSPATMETIDFSSLCSRILFRNALGYDYSDFGRDLGIMIMGDILPTAQGFSRISYNISLTNGHLPSIDDNNKSKEIQAVIFYRPAKYLNLKGGYNFGEYTGEKNPAGHKYQPMHRAVAGIWYDCPTGLNIRGEYGHCSAIHNGEYIINENSFYILAAWNAKRFVPVVRYEYYRNKIDKSATNANYDKYLAGLNFIACKNIKLQANYTLTSYTRQSRILNNGHKTSDQIQIMGVFSF